MEDCSIDRVARFRYYRPKKQRTFALTAASATASQQTRTHQIQPPNPQVKNFWIVFCLFALLAHLFMTTQTYMSYGTATETVIEMPTEVKPPATSVCFPLWDLIDESKLRNGSNCFAHLLTNRTRITNCATELFNRTFVSSILMDYSIDPVDLIVSFTVRQPSKNGTNWINKTAALRKDFSDFSGADAYKPGYVFSFYKGPYKCVRFTAVPLDSRTLSIDRMTTGYPRSRNFFIGYFKTNRRWTESMKAIRMYIHENGTFPRGQITLPAVANLSKAQTFVLTYTRIETHYLPSPYEHQCRDYTLSRFDSRLDCVTSCVRRNTIRNHNSMPWDDLLTSRGDDRRKFRSSNRTFVSPYEEYVISYEYDCTANCARDCVTKTFYTTLSETSANSLEENGDQLFEVNTRFENPETSVTFVPRLDFQAYIIYIAGVFGIWFSASIYHMGKDVGAGLRSGFKFLNHIY